MKEGNTAVISPFLTKTRNATQPSPELEAHWVELRDDRGKLQGKWDPDAGILEIQRRGVMSRYLLMFTETQDIFGGQLIRSKE